MLRYGCAKVLGGYILVYAVNLICVIVLSVKPANTVSGKVLRVWGWQGFSIVNGHMFSFMVIQLPISEWRIAFESYFRWLGCQGRNIKFMSQAGMFQPLFFRLSSCGHSIDVENI